MPYLIESALLTHGLPSISDETLAKSWPEELADIVWIDRGEIVTGGIHAYLPFRQRCAELRRAGRGELDQALREGYSAALTASGAMEVCRRRGLPLAVTCGIGGIGSIYAGGASSDLAALAELPVALVATAPKDMMDIPATLRWLAEHGVTVLGRSTPRCTGYLFRSTDAPLAGCLLPGEERPLHPGELLLNPIPEEERIADAAILAEGMRAGEKAAAGGGYYHPAANAFFDTASGGQAARIQLTSLINNALLAEKLTER